MSETQAMWTLRIVHPDGRGPAAGVPVTRLDGTENGAGYWVSDPDGLVRIPCTTDATVRLRVGLRSETPIDVEATRFQLGPVELNAPRDLPVTLAPRSTRTSGAQLPAELSGPASLPGQILQFARLLVLAPPAAPVEQLPLLSAGAHHSTRPASPQTADFFELETDVPTDLRYGALVEVEQYWQPLGYVTGDLLYSVALPPGDEARVAVLDGRWGEGALPRERPLQTLARLIGSPLLSDLVSEGGAAWPLDPLTLTLEGAGDVGAALAHGAAETVRYLNDRAQRVSETVRRAPFRVAETRGDVPADAAVRTVKNPRADRLMTYHFYEPLQRHRVIARAARVRPVVLIPFRLPNLAVRAMVRQYGHLLRRALLDRTLLPELDGLLGLASGAGVEWERAGTTPPVSELRFIVEPSPETAVLLPQLWCYLRADDARHTVHFFPVEAARGPLAQEHPEANHWIGAIRLADFHQHPLRYPGELALENGSPTTAFFTTVHLEGKSGETWRRLLTVENLVLPAQSQVQLSSLAALVDAAGLAARESRLLGHVAANLPHYAAAIIAGGDPGVRHLALSKVRDAEGRALSDVIENQVAGVLGNYLAFPLLSPQLAPLELRSAFATYAARAPRVPEEIVLTLPLPGVWISAQASAAIDGIAPGEEEGEGARDRAGRAGRRLTQA